MNDDMTRLGGACPRCARPLAADAPDGLCPACLLAAGTATLTQSLDSMATVSSHVVASSGEGDGPQRLVEGRPWGPYRIGRLLGRGGMGEVYEAEHEESGRRVAVKVLRGQLQHAEDRARFLREGQLAASISHPHTVYIFGSEEVAGTPVISMELLPGGTLKDRVNTHGPLPVDEAVSAILDIIGGLDAAQAAGILHRDIKPSNCFVDSDGTVKVGDFGLSISTLARDVQQDVESAGFQGTPQFAAPEQLRGEPLDVRADIYAVGATLYYLLTARPPFDARDLRELVARVASEQPVSPRRLRADVPAALAKVVLQCLAKTPPQRPPSYAALADALRPFSAVADRPASPWTRLTAGAIDSAIVGVPIALLSMRLGNPVSATATTAAALAAWSWPLTLVYFLAFESTWGASPGKRLMGLHVTTADGSRARVGPLLVRNGVYFLPRLVVGAVALFVSLPEIAATVLPQLLFWPLFSTMRRSNGWSTVHDMASGTRVVARTTRQVHHLGGSAAAMPSPAAAPDGARIGPYRVVSDSGETGPGSRLAIAFDPVLRRRIWIHIAGIDRTPIGGARQDVRRSTRLHWLAGRRAAGDSWDAFEAPVGAPFAQVGDTAGGWDVAGRWLVDLCRELTMAERDGTMPPLALDRLWVRQDGRLVLLDFPAPGRGRSRETPLNPTALLSATAARVLAARDVASPGATPLSARRLLVQWSASAPPSLDEAAKQLADVATTPSRVNRARRAASVLLAASPAALLLAISLSLLMVLQQVFMGENGEMLRLLGMLAAPAGRSAFTDPVTRDAAERYVAARFGERLRDQRYWHSMLLQQQPFLEPARIRQGILDRHPAVTANDLRLAEAQLPQGIVTPSTIRPGATFFDGSGAIVSTLLAYTYLLVVVISLVMSLLLPGGLLARVLGLAVVGRDGEEIGRLRSFVRAAITWLPALVWLGYLATQPRVQGTAVNPAAPFASLGLMLVVMSAGAAWAIARPARGAQDRIAGTWMVAR